jgi:hypothetical protein
MRALVAAACAAALLAPGDGLAQETAPRPVPPAQWTLATDANVFFGFNYQRRKFRDFSEWESQNWVAGTLERRAPGGTLRIHSMWSLEALTLRDVGSPQVFQTGETFRGAPLVDYQHPHDLVMGLGAEYRRATRVGTLIGAADLVGPPALGPAPFMHRPSARDNPQAPLSHHYLDSTHITPGVIGGGLEAGAWRADASWFRGREPDENRLDIDLGALDSTAARLSWTRGGWAAQVSGALLTQPERVTPADAKQLTASLAYAGGDDRRGIAWLAAFGQRREIHGNLEAYLFEAHVRAGSRTTVYTRVESAAKSILDVGFHPVGIFHRHRQSQVSALTAGYVRDAFQSRAGAVGLGADVTGYLVPANLKNSYGSPLSFHLFLRYRAPAPARGQESHVH